ncbi:hypothetical protein ACTFIU_003372 [Dictyostelium citrinum]
MASKKRSLPQVEDDWNGYESLMNVKPKERYDIKASIFDLNTIRDSALFEKERFSLCLSPPKEKPGTFKFSKSPTSPKSKIPNDSPPKQPKQRETFQLLQPNLNTIGNGGGITKIKKELPPSVQNQQTHQYNTRKIPTSMVPPQQLQQQQQQQQQQQPKLSQQHQQYLTKLTNVSNSPIKSLSQQPNSPLRKRFSSTSQQPPVVVTTLSSSSSSSSINTQQPPIKKLATNNNGVTQTTTNPPHTLQNRPATPTRPTNPVLNNKPSTPIKSLTNRPLTPSKQPLLTTNDLNNNITVTTASATSRITTSSLAKNTNNGINGLTTTPIDQSRLESRIKSLEIENKIINSKLEEKDQIIETLSGRVSELEFQLVNFMLEVKTCILEKDK